MNSLSTMLVRIAILPKHTRFGVGRMCIESFAQKNRHQRKNMMMNPSAAKGPYCFSINSQLILTAAFRYFEASSRNLPLISPILSRLSPLYSKSSMFLVMTLVTSFSSSFSLSRFPVALES